MVTDDEIAAMSDVQRRELIERLATAAGQDGWRRFGVLLTVCAVVLVPWIGYLAGTVPDDHTVHHWRLAWVGFDLLLLFFVVATAILGRRHHPLAVLFAFTTGVLLLCDAGFDLLTTGRPGLWQAAASAVLVELPLGTLMIVKAYRALGSLPVRWD